VAIILLIFPSVAEQEINHKVHKGESTLSAQREYKGYTYFFAFTVKALCSPWLNKVA